MSYAFKHQKGVGKQVREIAREQADKALDEASAGGDFDKTIHTLRRRCKKLRGLLRLVEPRFEDFAEENKSIRAAANALGASRDAAVVIETFDLLMADKGGDLPTEAVAEARGFLVARADRLAGKTTNEAVLRGFAEAMDAVRRRIDHWSFAGSGENLLLEGLGLTYGRMRKTARLAQKSGDSHDMHEWRKHAKNHLYHVTLLERCAPDVLKSRRHMMEKLGDDLGDHHNLAVLSEVLAEDESPVGDDFAQAFDAALREREAELAEDALAMGRQLLVEKPAALEKRFAGYWRLLKESGDGD